MMTTTTEGTENPSQQLASSSQPVATSIEGGGGGSYDNAFAISGTSETSGAGQQGKDVDVVVKEVNPDGGAAFGEDFLLDRMLAASQELEAKIRSQNHPQQQPAAAGAGAAARAPPRQQDAVVTAVTSCTEEKKTIDQAEDVMKLRDSGRVVLPRGTGSGRSAKNNDTHGGHDYSTTKEMNEPSGTKSEVPVPTATGTRGDPPAGGGQGRTTLDHGMVDPRSSSILADNNILATHDLPTSGDLNFKKQATSTPVRLGKRFTSAIGPVHQNSASVDDDSPSVMMMKNANARMEATLAFLAAVATEEQQQQQQQHENDSNQDQQPKKNQQIVLDEEGQQEPIATVEKQIQPIASANETSAVSPKPQPLLESPGKSKQSSMVESPETLIRPSGVSLGKVRRPSVDTPGMLSQPSVESSVGDDPMKAIDDAIKVMETAIEINGGNKDQQVLPDHYMLKNAALEITTVGIGDVGTDGSQEGQIPISSHGIIQTRAMSSLSSIRGSFDSEKERPSSPNVDAQHVAAAAAAATTPDSYRSMMEPPSSPYVTSPNTLQRSMVIDAAEKSVESATEMDRLQDIINGVSQSFDHSAASDVNNDQSDKDLVAGANSDRSPGGGIEPSTPTTANSQSDVDKAVKAAEEMARTLEQLAGSVDAPFDDQASTKSMNRGVVAEIAERELAGGGEVKLMKRGITEEQQQQIAERMLAMDPATAARSPPTGGSIRWEKVSYAEKGDDDFVPLADYSKKASKIVTPAPSPAVKWNKVSLVDEDDYDDDDVFGGSRFGFGRRGGARGGSKRRGLYGRERESNRIRKRKRQNMLRLGAVVLLVAFTAILIFLYTRVARERARTVSRSSTMEEEIDWEKVNVVIEAPLTVPAPEISPVPVLDVTATGSMLAVREDLLPRGKRIARKKFNRRRKPTPEMMDPCHFPLARFLSPICRSAQQQQRQQEMIDPRWKQVEVIRPTDEEEDNSSRLNDFLRTMMQ